MALSVILREFAPPIDIYICLLDSGDMPYSLLGCPLSRRSGLVPLHHARPSRGFRATHIPMVLFAFQSLQILHVALVGIVRSGGGYIYTLQLSGLHWNMAGQVYCLELAMVKHDVYSTVMKKFVFICGVDFVVFIVGSLVSWITSSLTDTVHTVLRNS